MGKIVREMTVDAPANEVYDAWHHFDSFPRFMRNVEDVRVVTHGRSHWRVKSHLGFPVEWDAEVTLEEPSQAIGWRSIRGSSVNVAGRVNFTPVGDSTRVEVIIDYHPPVGVVGNALSRLLVNPEDLVEEDLVRFKRIVEASAQPPQRMAA